MDSDKKISFLKQHGVDVEKGIETMMDFETYDDILNDFYEALPGDLSKIEDYKNTNDMPNYAILVHSLKSNARSFGFNELADLAYEHELKSKANDASFVSEHFDELASEANKTLELIKSYKEL